MKILSHFILASIILVTVASCGNTLRGMSNDANRNSDAIHRAINS